MGLLLSSGVPFNEVVLGIAHFKAHMEPVKTPLVEISVNPRERLTLSNEAGLESGCTQMSPEF